MTSAMEITLKYPVLLVHGMGFRDDKRFSYWGRIPQVLEELGCNVYFGTQDGNADVETNGTHLAHRIQQILEETGRKKSISFPIPREVWTAAMPSVL